MANTEPGAVETGSRWRKIPLLNGDPVATPARRGSVFVLSIGFLFLREQLVEMEPHFSSELASRRWLKG